MQIISHGHVNLPNKVEPCLSCPISSASPSHSQPSAMERRLLPRRCGSLHYEHQGIRQKVRAICSMARCSLPAIHCFRPALGVQISMPVKKRLKHVLRRSTTACANCWHYLRKPSFSPDTPVCRSPLMASPS